MPRVFYSSRHGGVSRNPFDSFNLGTHVGDEIESVRQNREILRANLCLTSLAFMDQRHGADISVIAEPAQANLIPDADALMTNQKGIGLAVMVADCVPLLLAAEGWVAAVHVGRVGLMSNIVESVLRKFDELGAAARDAWIGPHICQECYEVDSNMYRELTASRPLLATTDEKHCLNLKAPIVDVLVGQGVRVHDLSRCTVETDDLFSYRRDGMTGRFAGVIAL